MKSSIFPSATPGTASFIADGPYPGLHRRGAGRQMLLFGKAGTMTSRHNALHRCIARLYDLIGIDTYYLNIKKIISMAGRINEKKEKFSPIIKILCRYEADRAYQGPAAGRQAAACNHLALV